jgi:vancomycin permeability regulator SanA
MARYPLIIKTTLGLPFAASLWIVYSGMREEPCLPDVAVVLGNTVFPDGTPSPRLRARLDQARELQLLGSVRNIIVSGGTGIEGPNEAEAMAQYLIERGVPPESLFTDPHGDTTSASALNSKRIADDHAWRGVIVISQYFHLPRSRLAFTRAGFERVCSSYARYWEFRDLYSILREIIALPVYRFRRDIGRES